jgi:GDP-4-dehydro-6-deoxy-D-mannose reductase
MEKKRIVISGINGFVGQHLARELHKNNIVVIGIGHDTHVASAISDIVDTYHSQDLVSAWPDTGDVDGVIHLAGLAAVGPSFDDPQLYINTNSAMVTNMGQYYLNQKFHPRLLIISSGAIYSPDQTMPINETANIGLSSPYAVSKVLTENQATYYSHRGLECVVARPFNHIGPGQAKGFILPDFYDRLAETSEGVIKVGNINTKRDYTDVRDIVRAYVALILAPELQHSVYNVCSGKSVAGSEILNKLKHIMHKDSIMFEIDQTLVRPTDIQEISGDSSRLRSELGWAPDYTIDQTIGDFVTAKTVRS